MIMSKYQIKIRKLGKVLKGYEADTKEGAIEKAKQLGSISGYKLEVIKKKEKAKKLKKVV